MRAAYYDARGAAREVLQVGELPEPVAAEGEVLVRLKASGTNPSDVKTRNGNMGPMTAPRVVPHSDGTGLIEAVGAGVSQRRVGERVWLFNVNRTADGMGQGDRGTAAELVAVPASLAVPLANGVSFEEGACLGVPAMTAHRALFADGSITGQTVLITGGAGAVGSMAIQMAAAAGAKVITTVSSEAKAATAREDGAAVVINYREEEVGPSVLAANDGQPVDRLVDVDFASHINLTPEILKSSGTIAAYASMSQPQPQLTYYPLMFNNTNIRLVFVYAMPEAAKRAAERDIDDFLRSGALRPRVAATHPLDAIVAAHEQVEGAGQIGNVIVTL